MNSGFLVVAGIVTLLGLLCLWFWKKFNNEIALMAATPTSRAADVAALQPGTIVEVKGTIRCDKPLSGEFSKKSCVYMKSEVEREEVRWRDGKRETEWVTERTTERHAPFYVEDASGRVLVHGDGANIEAIEVYNASGNTAAENILSLGLSLLGAGSTERRLKERILAPDIPVYVLGTRLDSGSIGAAPKGAKIKEFLITYKSKEEHTRSSRKAAIALLIIAIVLFAGAIASLWAAIRHPVS